MNPARPTAAVLLGLLALGAAAPAARAGTAPDPVVAGERVSISDDGRCGPARVATAASELFGAVALRPGATGMAAEVRVGERAAPGRYRVTIECGRGGSRHVATVTVAEGRADSVGVAQAAAGAALLALAVGAAYLLRRSVRERTGECAEAGGSRMGGSGGLGGPGGSGGPVGPGGSGGPRDPDGVNEPV